MNINNLPEDQKNTHRGKNKKKKVKKEKHFPFDKAHINETTMESIDEGEITARDSNQILNPYNNPNNLQVEIPNAGNEQNSISPNNTDELIFYTRHPYSGVQLCVNIINNNLNI